MANEIDVEPFLRRAEFLAVKLVELVRRIKQAEILIYRGALDICILACPTDFRVL